MKTFSIKWDGTTTDVRATSPNPIVPREVGIKFYNVLLDVPCQNVTHYAFQYPNALGEIPFKKGPFGVYDYVVVGPRASAEEIGEVRKSLLTTMKAARYKNPESFVDAHLQKALDNAPCEICIPIWDEPQMKHLLTLLPPTFLLQLGIASTLVSTAASDAIEVGKLGDWLRDFQIGLGQREDGQMWAFDATDTPQSEADEDAVFNWIHSPDYRTEGAPAPNADEQAAYALMKKRRDDGANKQDLWSYWPQAVADVTPYARAIYATLTCSRNRATMIASRFLPLLSDERVAFLDYVKKFPFADLDDALDAAKTAKHTV